MSTPSTPSTPSTEYICCTPSICLKDATADSPYIQKIYSSAPYADYFKTYKSSGKKAKLGTWSIHEPEQGGPGVINLYLRIYPGEKNMKSDTAEMRRAYFQQIMKTLDGKYKMTFDPAELQFFEDNERLDCQEEDIVNVLLYETDYAVVLP